MKRISKGAYACLAATSASFVLTEDELDAISQFLQVAETALRELAETVAAYEPERMIVETLLKDAELASDIRERIERRS